MVLLGLFNWGSALAGLLGSTRFACCLDAFLALHGVDVVLTIAMVAKLWADVDGVAAAVGARAGLGVGGGMEADTRRRMAQACHGMRCGALLVASRSTHPPRLLHLPSTDPTGGSSLGDTRVRQVLRAAQWLLPLILAVQLGALVVALVVGHARASRGAGRRAGAGGRLARQLCYRPSALLSHVTPAAIAWGPKPHAWARRSRMSYTAPGMHAGPDMRPAPDASAPCHTVAVPDRCDSCCSPGHTRRRAPRSPRATRLSVWFPWLT